MIARRSSAAPTTSVATLVVRMYYHAMPVDSETVPVNEPAPDFELPAISGESVRLSSLRGKIVVLVFLRGFM